MATIHLHNLPEEVHSALRLRAARAGRSVEEEARAILVAACREEPSALSPGVLRKWAEEACSDYCATSAVDDLIAERRREAERG